MPTGEHEAPIALGKLNPDTLGWLLVNVLGVKVSDHDHTHKHATDVRVMVPRTYHADGMTVFCDAQDRPLYGVVLEVQRSLDKSKRWMWPLYTAQLEAELEVPVALLVYCPDPAVARSYREMFEPEGLSLRLRPFIFTPEDVPLLVDVEEARANPGATVLSALCHSADPELEAMFPALVAALSAVSKDQVEKYYDIVLGGLPPIARERWERFMTTDTVGQEFHSDFMRKVAAERAENRAAGRAEGKAEGKAVGKAEGEAQGVLTVLDARGLAVPDVVREQILACTDLAQLDTWLRRAVTATTAEDVIRR